MASPLQQGQCDRVAPVAFVHRVRHDRPKEAHPDEYAALERYSESGQEEQFWAVVARSRHQHHDNSAILFFLEYKTCEFKCVRIMALCSLWANHRTCCSTTTTDTRTRTHARAHTRQHLSKQQEGCARSTAKTQRHRECQPAQVYVLCVSPVCGAQLRTLTTRTRTRPTTNGTHQTCAWR